MTNVAAESIAQNTPYAFDRRLPHWGSRELVQTRPAADDSGSRRAGYARNDEPLARLALPYVLVATYVALSVRVTRRNGPPTLHCHREWNEWKRELPVDPPPPDDPTIMTVAALQQQRRRHCGRGKQYIREV